MTDLFLQKYLAFILLFFSHSLRTRKSFLQKHKRKDNKYRFSAIKSYKTDIKLTPKWLKIISKMAKEEKKIGDGLRHKSMYHLKIIHCGIYCWAVSSIPPNWISCKQWTADDKQRTIIRQCDVLTAMISFPFFSPRENLFSHKLS